MGVGHEVEDLIRSRVDRLVSRIEAQCATFDMVDVGWVTAAIREEFAVGSPETNPNLASALSPTLSARPAGLYLDSAPNGGVSVTLYYPKEQAEIPAFQERLHKLIEGLRATTDGIGDLDLDLDPTPTTASRDPADAFVPLRCLQPHLDAIVGFPVTLAQTPGDPRAMPIAIPGVVRSQPTRKYADGDLTEEEVDVFIQGVGTVTYPMSHVWVYKTDLHKDTVVRDRDIVYATWLRTPEGEPGAGNVVGCCLAEDPENFRSVDSCSACPGRCPDRGKLPTRDQQGRTGAWRERWGQIAGSSNREPGDASR